jgi:hypothetical protein
MTPAELLKIKAEADARPDLFSARTNRDYETIASILNEKRPKDAKLTTLHIHEAMIYVRPEEAEAKA